LIHAGCIFLGILLFHSYPPGSSTLANKDHTLYAVIEGPKKAVLSSHESRKSRKNSSRTSSIPLSHLALPKNGSSSSPGDASPTSENTGLSFQEATKEQAFLSALYNRIQNNLTYPSELIDAKKAGTIRVSFKVDRQGKLIGEFFDVDAEDRSLARFH
jgi:hypothetical protein